MDCYRLTLYDYTVLTPYKQAFTHTVLAVDNGLYTNISDKLLYILWHENATVSGVLIKMRANCFSQGLSDCCDAETERREGWIILCFISGLCSGTAVSTVRSRHDKQEALERGRSETLKCTAIFVQNHIFGRAGRYRLVTTEINVWGTIRRISLKTISSTVCSAMSIRQN